MSMDNLDGEGYDNTLRIVQRAIARLHEGILNTDSLATEAELNRVFESVRQVFDDLGLNISDYLPQDIVAAYADGYVESGDELLNAGMASAEIVGNLQSRVHLEAAQQLAVDGVDDLQAAFRTALQYFMNDVTSALREAQDLQAEGILVGDSTKVITQRVKAKYAEYGFTGFITSDNRRLPLDFYASTVTRVKVRSAHVRAAQNRYEENGVTLVRINTRQPTCHICAARQGLIISLTGEHENVPTVDDIGGLPPFHPNCRHYIIPELELDYSQVSPFRENRDTRTAAQRDNYEQEQAIRRKANEEKKQYMRMKAEATARGEDFPNIGVWRRQKRKNDESWKALQEAYKRSVANI